MNIFATACAVVGLFSQVSAQQFEFTRQMLPAENAQAEAIAIGDLDGDGDLDAFVGNAGYAQRNHLYLNEGTGKFTDVTATHLPVLAPSSFYFTNAVALGDVDSDGDLDAFLGNSGCCFPSSSPAANHLYLNNGAGVFTDVTVSHLPLLLDVTYAVALGDVDGDGDLDAFLGNDGQDRLYLNSGGVFTDRTTTHLPVYLDFSSSVALGDVDTDGDLDALVGNAGTAFPGSQSRLYRNGGSGVFADVTATQLPSVITFTESVALGDVDGDGDLDAFLGNSGSLFGTGRQNLLYRNNGAGTFTDVTVANLPAILSHTYALAVADVDLDGDLDAFAGNAGLDHLYINNGSGMFAELSSTRLPALSTNSRAVALGDLDMDGDTDVLMGNAGQDFLYLNHGAGTFSDVTALGIPPLLNYGFPVQSVALGDIDGDGDLDALVAALPHSRLFLNSGAGTFADMTTTHLPGVVASQAIALGDVDGDGDLDAFLGAYGQGRLYLNGGVGVFADVTASHVPALSSDTRAVALGDVDSDGDLDVILGNYGAQSRLLKNNGTGVLSDVTSTHLPAIVDATRAVAMGDVDDDGDLDVLVGNRGAAFPSFIGQSRLYLNGGTGVFSDATVAKLPALLADTLAVGLGDVDGDGDLDAYIGNRNQDFLYLNNGTGGFVDVTATNLPIVFDGTYGVALGDVDEDGDLDVFAGNTTSAAGGQDRIYLNNGSGTFADGTSVGMPAVLNYTGSVALADVDGDGDVDGFTGERLYVNRSRQLAWRALPRIGKPLILELSGPAMQPWILGVSPIVTSILLVPFGTLRLDPAALLIVGTGALDANGRGSTSLFVPVVPALIGLTVYWQGLVGAQPLLTNLEITTVTGL